MRKIMEVCWTVLSEWPFSKRASATMCKELRAFRLVEVGPGCTCTCGGTG